MSLSEGCSHSEGSGFFFFYFGPKSDVVGFFGGGIVKLKTLFFLAFPPAKAVVGLFSCIRVVL